MADDKKCQPYSRLSDDAFEGIYPCYIGCKIDLEKNIVRVADYDPTALAIRESVHRFSDGKIAGHEHISNLCEIDEFNEDVIAMKESYEDYNLGVAA